MFRKILLCSVLLVVPSLSDASETVRCMDVWTPVCGVNGQTYSNACYAAAANVDVECENACPCAVEPRPRWDVANPIVKKVMVVEFNPLIESAGKGVRLTDVQGWGDPATLETGFVDGIGTASDHHVNYQIVQRHVVDAFPVKTDGFQFDDASYLDCINNQIGCPSEPPMVDYNAILDDWQVCEARNNGTIDEVWIWGGPYFGYYEANMTGPGAFHTNGPVVTETTCDKQLHIMGYNYEREVPEMLENFGHRVEGVMRNYYGSWAYPYGAPPTSAPPVLTLWDQFSVKDYDPGPPAACGYAHGSINTAAWDPVNNWWGYDWTNSRVVQSTCDDWLAYPDLHGTTQPVNCLEWGCDKLPWFLYWLGHLPRYADTHDGTLNSWWRYATEYDVATAVRNNSFEQNLDHWSFGRINRLPQSYAAHSGDWGMEVNQPCPGCPSDYGEVYSFKHDVPGNFVVGETYTFSIWMKHNGSGWFNGTIAVWEAGGAWSDDAHSSPWQVHRDDGWIRLTQTATILRPGRDLLKLEVYLDTPYSNANFDDASLVTGTAEPSTPIRIRATGTPCQGAYPTMKLSTSDLDVEAGEWTVSDSWAIYGTSAMGDIDPSTTPIKVWFTNDAHVSGVCGRDLRVDWIEVDGVRYETEAGSTYSTGTWASDSCAAGYPQSEWLHCNGFFQY